jgi:predicted transcriptional regulator
MKSMRERLKTRLRKDRPMTTISIRMPEDVIEDLKEIAPALGMSGYQPLIRAYIGQGLRRDLERLDNSQMQAITESLRKQGVADELISAAIADAGLKTA